MTGEVLPIVGPGDSGEEQVVAVVRAATPEVLRRVKAPVSFGCRARARLESDGTWSAMVVGPRSAVQALDSRELAVTIRQASRAQEPGTPRRLVPGRSGWDGGPVSAPRDAGDYLTVEEVEAKLAQLADAYPTLSELITLPHLTWEGRTSHALRIGTRADQDTAVLFTACAHAREWGGAEIALGFAADLLAAYTAGENVYYNEYEVPADVVAQIVQNLTVVVFPCVNPDGRAWDMADPSRWWRKNRRPLPDGNVGVDINRNHDWLWDYRTAFDPRSYTDPDDSGGPGSYVATAPASDDPSDPLYHGPAPDSEPETRNIHALFDLYPNISWYMDIHSYDGDVLFSWSDDNDQSADPQMTFLNHAYDGQRGISGGYGEYLPADQRSLDESTAEAIVAAMNTVDLPMPPNAADPTTPREYYQAFQSCLLWADERYPGQPDHVAYPCSGTVDDWAAARHQVNPGAALVHSFVVEYNFPDVADGDGNPFHPAWPTMRQIVSVVDAGMLTLCQSALPATGGGGGGGGGGHQQPCFQMQLAIGKLEQAIAAAVGPGPGVAQRRAQLEKQLATLSATYQKLCGHIQPPIHVGG